MDLQDVPASRQVVEAIDVLGDQGKCREPLFEFGEGVVTGLEPGGIVVIRFSRDGSERKMLSQYAHLTRR